VCHKKTHFLFAAQLVQHVLKQRNGFFYFNLVGDIRSVISKMPQQRAKHTDSLLVMLLFVLHFAPTLAVLLAFPDSSHVKYKC